jgi:SNF2 family DNA or RNA helicase
MGLFDFQQEGVDKLWQQEAVLVADEMGLGKTYTAIELDRCHRQSDVMWTAPKRTLVIAPLTVLSSWADHCNELTSLPFFTVDPKNRDKSFETFMVYTDNDRGGIFLCHWDVLRFFVKNETFKKVYWHHVIADECHRAKNRKAQQTQALKKIKCKFKTAMSGTPVVNRPDELWSILNWLYPNAYSAYWRFFERYTEYTIKYPEGYKIVTGPKNVRELQTKMDPFFVRRLKKDVLKDLPDKYYTPLWVELSGPQRKAYDSMRKEMIAWVGQHADQPLVAPVIIAQLIRLQQFAVASAALTADGVILTDPSSKVDALMQILEDNPDEQIVVWSQFKQLIRLVNERLARAKIAVVSVTGDVAQSQRGENVRRFQRGDVRVFSGTISAGGVGITLHASSTAVFLDRSWSPAVNLQAEDRQHRIGQKNAVQIIDIMARDTVDLGRQQKLELKWSWIRSLLGDT